MSAIRKLPAVPSDLTKVAEALAGEHCVVLNYKTDKKTQVKKPSVAYIVPKLSLQDEITIEGQAINKWIDSLQRSALAEYHAGDYDYYKAVTDLDALFNDYVVDNRGNRTGPKQSDLMEWISDVLVPFFTARIEENLTGFTVEQKQNTVISYVKKFRLAATRGNKSGNETLSDAALKDLQQRMERWISNPDDEKNIPQSDERDCIIERIATHRATIAKQIVDVTTNDF